MFPSIHFRNVYEKWPGDFRTYAQQRKQSYLLKTEARLNRLGSHKRKLHNLPVSEVRLENKFRQ
jgi:hypothetical protein